MAVRLIISGRVQGVWYRDWTVEQATQRGLSGWVRNRADGTVEALFAGPEVELREMVAACHQGPPGARVTAIAEYPADPPQAAGFIRLPTA